MQNLYDLEKEVERRSAEVLAEARHASLVREARSPVRWLRPPIPIDRAVRFRLGVMLIRLGTRLAA